MKRVVVVPFASRLHGEAYYSSVYEITRKYVEDSRVGAEILPVITTSEEIAEIAEKYTDTLPVLVALTGGVSKLMREFVYKGNHSRVVLFGHGGHNSLASAISARSKLNLDGVKTALFHCFDVESPECLVEIKRMLRVTRATSTLLGSRVLLVRPFAEKPNSALEFEERFEATVDVFTIDDFTTSVKAIREDYVNHFLEVFGKVEFRVQRDRLTEVAEVYALLKSMAEEGRYDAIAVDCFPYLVKYRVTPCLALALLNSEGVVAACEGDLASLALMAISRALVGTAGWIANAVAFKGKKSYFAHCTISLDMVKDPVVVTHFESGHPYSLTGKLVGNVYTIISLSPDLKLMATTTGRVLESGLLYGSMCRTQAILELDVDSEKLPSVAVSNHHVLVPGDIREDLATVASLLGINYVEYRELLAPSKQRA